MMGHIIMLALVVLAGAVLSMQAAINGRLGESVGVIRSSQLTFVVGAVFSGLLIFFFEPTHSQTLLTVPKWQLAGALFGMFYMLVMVASVPKIGVATATVAVICGQLSMGMMIDTFGWFGNQAIGFSSSRMAALVCLALTLVLIYRSNQAEEQSTE